LSGDQILLKPVTDNSVRLSGTKPEDLNEHKQFQQLALNSSRKGRVSAFGALQSPATIRRSAIRTWDPGQPPIPNLNFLLRIG
jgi:hypothetical protein